MAAFVKIVLTREAGKNESLVAWLPPDATVGVVPLTTTTYFDPDDVRAALERLPSNGKFHTLVMTSERSADYVEMAVDASAPDVEVYGVGAITAEAVNTRGIRVRTPREGSAEALAPDIVHGPVLMIGALAMRDELPTALRAKGLEVATVACYETVGVTLDLDDAETLRRADILFIGAPSAWAVARALVSSDTWVVVPGESTGAVVRVDHARVIEGWGPALTTRLDDLST
jgi:uroporphyrinogen-III synthase